MNIRLVNERWLDLAESAAASSVASDPAPVDPAPQAAGDWPPIPQRVSFVATGCHSERELALAGYMAAAAAAGIGDVQAQRQFADQMLARVGWQLSEERPDGARQALDDELVRARFAEQRVTLVLGAQAQQQLAEFRQRYVAGGGQLSRLGDGPVHVDLEGLKELGGLAGNYGFRGATAVRRYRVVLSGEGNPTDAVRLLAQHVTERYSGPWMWGDGARQVAEMALLRGMRVRVVSSERVGRQWLVEYELEAQDEAELAQLSELVGAESARAAALARAASEQNEVASFLRGMWRAAWQEVCALGSLVEVRATLAAVWEMVSHPVATVQALCAELAAVSEEFARANATRRAEMVGELFGHAVVGVLVGKGAGAAGQVLARTKTGAAVLARAEQARAVVAARVAEAFSDEAAAAAAARFRAAADARLYSGILADPDLLLDAAVVAGNLFRKGVTKFSEFRDALLRKLGKPIEQYVESLYVKQLVDSMVEQGRRLKATGGRELSVTVERDLTERAVRSVMNEQPEDLKKLLAEVKNRYGSEVESEIKRRVNEAVKNIHEGRRSVEVHDLLGGHTLAKHVGQSKQRLLDRFKHERDLRYASSFASRDLADWAQREFIKHYKQEIKEWLETNEPMFEAGLELNIESVGVVIDKKGREHLTNKIWVVLVRDETSVKYHVHTSFPIK